MYSEQLAILLLVAANGLSGPGVGRPALEARVPRGGAEQVSVNLKIDPRLTPQRTLQARKMLRRKEADVLFASNE